MAGRENGSGGFAPRAAGSIPTLTTDSGCLRRLLPPALSLYYIPLLRLLMSQRKAGSRLKTRRFDDASLLLFAMPAFAAESPAALKKSLACQPCPRILKGNFDDMVERRLVGIAVACSRTILV